MVEPEQAKVRAQGAISKAQPQSITQDNAFGNKLGVGSITASGMHDVVMSLLQPISGVRRQ